MWTAFNFLAEIILTTFDKPFGCVSNDPLSIQGGPLLKGSGHTKPSAYALSY